MAVGVRRFTPSRVTRRFGAFAVLTLRAIGQIRRGEWTGPEAAAHFDQLARTHGLRETGHYDPRLLVAHDASGPPAIDWALAHPERVAGLVLLNTYYCEMPTLRRPEAIWLFSTPALARP